MEQWLLKEATIEWVETMKEARTNHTLAHRARSCVRSQWRLRTYTPAHGTVVLLLEPHPYTLPAKTSLSNVGNENRHAHTHAVTHGSVEVVRAAKLRRLLAAPKVLAVCPSTHILMAYSDGL